MKKYVMGFQVCTHPSQQKFVAMILKFKGPAYVVGKWNGIGGSVEDGESSPTAMVREFLEETGVRTVAGNWINFATLKGNDWIVDCFYSTASYTTALLSLESEPVAWISFDHVYNLPIPDNLHWILPYLKHCVETASESHITVIETP